MNTDSMGAFPSSTRAIAMHARPDLVEGSAAVQSDQQPGIIFTVNDSGNEPVLFAVDTGGNDRGAWRVDGAVNRDWEAAALGPCAAGASPGAVRTCLYIGDVGDNASVRNSVTVYRVHEPMASHTGFTASLPADQVTFRYDDAPHDVEAMVVTPDGTVLLFTKRSLKNGRGVRRPALVFALDAGAWNDTLPHTARLVDSLPIIPGSDDLREITDASLSRDARWIAIRTYGQVYIFPADSITGRITPGAVPARCNVALTEDEHGEGITWYHTFPELLLTSEGYNAPMHVITCPLPSR